jgi:tRNA U38,U39,U40 pseudouridine synthase TruA
VTRWRLTIEYDGGPFMGWQPDDMRKALEARDRSALGFNAPPHGLYFVEAIYP